MKASTAVTHTTFGLSAMLTIATCKQILMPRPDASISDHALTSVGIKEGGVGLYRDPLEVFGARFPRSCMTSLCENKVQMRADNAVHGVRFTRRGARLCRTVCARYRDAMAKNRGAADVQHSWPGYCDYTGKTVDPAPDDLGTACKCTYRVRCDGRTELVVYSFEADAAGNVRASVSEWDRKRYVTAYLLSARTL